MLGATKLPPTAANFSEAFRRRAPTSTVATRPPLVRPTWGREEPPGVGYRDIFDLQLADVGSRFLD
jgi:hypothetical protein